MYILALYGEMGTNIRRIFHAVVLTSGLSLYFSLSSSFDVIICILTLTIYVALARYTVKNKCVVEFTQPDLSGYAFPPTRKAKTVLLILHLIYVIAFLIAPLVVLTGNDFVQSLPSAERIAPWMLIVGYYTGSIGLIGVLVYALNSDNLK